MTSKSDVVALMRILLGRLPSEKAMIELQARSITESVCNIVTSAEFRSSAIEPLLERRETVHEERRLHLDADDIRWVKAHIPLGAASIKSLSTTKNWSDLMRLIVTDADLCRQLKKTLGDSGRVEAFMDAIASVSTAPAPSESNNDAPSAAAAAPASSATPVTPAAPAVELGTSRSLSEGATDAAVKVFEKILTGQDKSARGQILDLHKKDPGPGVIWLYHQCQKNPSIKKPVRDYVTFTAARVFLKFFMSETAFQLADNLHSRASELVLFSESEINRLYKLRALAAVRSGRADVGIRQYEELIATYPLDWEAYFLLGDFIMQTAPDKAEQLLRTSMECGKELNPNQIVSIADFLHRRGDQATAVRLLRGLKERERPHPDVHTSFANFALRHGSKSAWRQHMCNHFESQGLTGKDLLIDDSNSLFGFGERLSHKKLDHPLITIVMTSFNSAATIEHAVKSIVNQTYGNFELIIVDDCSTDNSRAIIKNLALRYPRVKYIFNDYNMGTYCSKNQAVVEAKGEYITFHDSDDWMHPQRLETHLKRMTERDLITTVSSWIRMTSEGESILRKGGGFVHRNPASTFIRRAVFDKIGVFDSVRTGADTEMLWRIKSSFGAANVEEMDDVLALGLHHENSLTTAGVTAFDEFRYSPVRLKYWENWVGWHFDNILAGKSMIIPIGHNPRQFVAPDEIAVT
ncbi:glycosyltransferase [Rhodopseudomonas palustris]|nr:glycosyltransferase [Rhodopseudomonas palustris]